jgi:hypothetical protein
VRTPIRHLVDRTVDHFRRFNVIELFTEARRLILEQEGSVTLDGNGNAYQDFESYFAGQTTSH